MSVEPRAYVTYFDQRYLARAIAMLRSLRRHDPQAEIFALCFDATACDIVVGLADAKITAISAATIGKFEPRLADYADRSRWEFYATHKPVLPLYVFAHRTEIAAIAHIDADTWFFSAPAPLFDEIGQASIALSPHRFSPAYARAAIYGAFNAGFIYWRNDAIGLRCLKAYREDCFRWCADRAEPDGRYMNQGYLTAWPERYPGTHVIRHPGVNLGYWNIAGHGLSAKPAVSVDGAPLIFYHFSNIHQDGNGIWRSRYADFGAQSGLALRGIYDPYLSEVDKTERWLRGLVPDLLPIDAPLDLATLPILRHKPQRALKHRQ